MALHDFLIAIPTSRPLEFSSQSSSLMNFLSRFSWRLSLGKRKELSCHHHSGKSAECSAIDLNLGPEGSVNY
jgi:hypothetical protein